LNLTQLAIVTLFLARKEPGRLTLLLKCDKCGAFEAARFVSRSRYGRIVRKHCSRCSVRTLETRTHRLVITHSIIKRVD